MENLIRELKFDAKEIKDGRSFLNKEWLITNGLGGYSSGTIGGAVTRRFHSYLTAALPTPLGRMVLFNHLSEEMLIKSYGSYRLSTENDSEDTSLDLEVCCLQSFRLELGLPVWTFRIKDVVLEKRLLMPYKQNTIILYYKLLEGKHPVKIKLRPSFNFRPHEAPVNVPIEDLYEFKVKGSKIEITANQSLPTLKMMHYNPETSLTIDSGMTREVYYRIEGERGYESKGVLWSPGYFRSFLSEGQEVVISASTEEWDVILALNPHEARNSEIERRNRLIKSSRVSSSIGAELTLAADQFIINPVGRVEDAARARASGDEVRSVIAGYHWFTDWGRDTMISLEGLTLTTGRLHEARWILRTFAHYVKDGLIPNMFPEGKKTGLYHTADATLWFFHALDRYLKYSNDEETLSILIPVLKDIIEHHINGTDFGIRVDKEDGLLIQGKEGYQLTWMDAKVDDWVVTPRRGKAVEINALWYNALCLAEHWIRSSGDNETADRYSEAGSKARTSFNKKFWMEDAGYLFDVIEGENGNDSSCRPNQVFAISLFNPVLDRDKWEPVMNTVKEKLLTPVGLRSLAPGDKDYKAKYYGNLRARDAAYHQGTVWGWLIGPYVDAYMKVYPEQKENVVKLLDGFEPHLNAACIGTISEIFDAEAPYYPRGCVAQAWSIAEVLRCHALLREDRI